MKNKLFLCLGIALMIPSVVYSIEKVSNIWNASFTSGYVFKYNDAHFKDVYGSGIANVITADGSYQPWEYVAFGTQISYWLAHGQTALFQERTHLQELPIIVYVRGIKQTKRDVRVFLSLGGGPVWVKETSYLGSVHAWKGIGDVEVGFEYPLGRHCNITAAFRYLFPRQSQDRQLQDVAKITVGGFDLRAGLGFSF